MILNRPHRTLYSHIEPRLTGRLKVSKIHELYWEECGNPNGLPVIALHGGPGGGSTPEMRRFFDPSRYRIFLFDQRGCGRSRPLSELSENTTWHLVNDIELLRKHFEVDRWIVFGGSWGSTLGLTYAIKHTERVIGLILRGIFLLTKRELDWFYQSGAKSIFPDSHERFIKPIPPNEREDLIGAFYARVTSQDKKVRQVAAKAWTDWEHATLTLNKSPPPIPRFSDSKFIEAFARIECHYFKNGGFFESDNWLLDSVANTLQNTPGIIAQGRYDVVTPVLSAWQLKKVWPRAELHIVPASGHSSLEIGISDRLVKATDTFADRFYRRQSNGLR